MKITETNAEGLKRAYNIVVPSADIEKKVNARITEIGNQVTLPGFRPGKAPLGLLRKRYSTAVMGEVLELTVRQATEDLLKEKELRPAMQPKVEIVSFEDGKDLEFGMDFEIIPDFKVCDYKEIKLEKPVAEVQEDEVKKSLERLAENKKDSEPVKTDRKSKKGDIAVINFVGSIDGEKFQGGEGKDFNLELGSNMFIPGFEEQLIGAKKGDKIDVKVPFPKEYHAKDLAGKDALFEVEVTELRTPKKAKIDDEFAKSLGEENLESLKKAIKDRIAMEYENTSKMRLKRSLLDQLADKHDFDVPASMVDVEFNAIWSQYEQAKKMGQLDPEDKDKSEKELKEEYKNIAERRVRLGLVLSDIGAKNNVTVGQEDLNKAIFTEATRFPGQEKAVFDYYTKNKQALESLRAPIFEDKVVDLILDKVNVEDKKVSVEDLFKEPDLPEGIRKPSKSSKKKSASKKKSSAKKTASKKKAGAKKKASTKKAGAKKKSTAKKKAE